MLAKKLGCVHKKLVFSRCLQDILDLRLVP